MICSKKDGLSKEDQFLMKLYCGCMAAVVLYIVVSSCEPHHVTLAAITIWLIGKKLLYIATVSTLFFF